MRRKRPRRNRSCQVRVQRPQPTRTNESWRMDFMADQLFSGQRFRILTLVNNFRRESLAIRVGQRLTGDPVVETLQAVLASPPTTYSSSRLTAVYARSVSINTGSCRWTTHNITSTDGEPITIISGYTALSVDKLRRSMPRAQEKLRKVPRNKLENQSKPKTGMRHSVRARPGRGLAGRYPNQKTKSTSTPSGSNLGARSRPVAASNRIDCCG